VAATGKETRRALTPLDEALALVREASPGPVSEEVPLGEALGRVLAADATSDTDVPAFDNSAMDGFAVRAEDTAGAGPDGPVLRLVGESSAGSPARMALEAGQAIAISTGAALPAGADAILRVEDSTAVDGGVRALATVAPGRDVRRAGDDIRAGATVLGAGAPIGPAELGVLASLGIGAPVCARRPRVYVLTTGEELIEPEDEPYPGSVRNTNARAVPAQALGAGCELAAVESVGDDRDATLGAVERGLAEADLVVACGGVSVGEHDHVKAAFAAAGVEEVFWGVALRPGRPTWFGRTASGAAPKLVFGLPGNPVSAMVTFHLFVRLAAAAMLGVEEQAWRIPATLAQSYEKAPGRAHAIRCRLEPGAAGWLATPTGEQGSHVLTSMLGADALVTIAAELETVETGSAVVAEPFSPLSFLAREAIPPPTRR
jgi:molybdopterin molybdotransferase